MTDPFIHVKLLDLVSLLTNFALAGVIYGPRRHSLIKKNNMLIAGPDEAAPQQATTSIQ